MATGGDYHETLPLDVEAGGVLVHVLIGNDLSLQLGSRVVAIVASGRLPRVIHRCVRQHAFDRVSRYLARREGISRDYCRIFREHGRYFFWGQLTAIELAKVGEPLL